MNTEFQGYQGFQETQSMLQADLVNLENCCQELDLEDTRKSIVDLRTKMAKDSFNIAVIGEFKRGKSTLINGLLGERILPADPLPCTATLNRIKYDVTPHALIKTKDGEEKEVSVEELEGYVTKFGDAHENIREAVVYYPLAYCKNRVDIIDTPGLNDDETMTDVTLSVIPKADLSIFVIMALSPFSQYEKDFLENKLMTSDIGKIVFAVTKMDLVDEEDRDRVLQYVREEIKEHILVKAEKVYGKDSEEYQNYVQKLGDIKVIGISPKLALKGKEKGNEEALQESNYPAFEEDLEKMIVTDRGLIQLKSQTNKIISASTEVVKAITLYGFSRQMSLQELEEKSREAQESFKKLRAEREREEARIETSGKSLIEDLKPMFEAYWTETEAGVKDVIAQFPMTADDLKKEKVKETQKKLTDEIEAYLNNAQYLLNDKIQTRVNEAVGKEAEKIGQFGEGFMQSLETVHVDFLGEKPSTKGEIVGATSSFLGALIAASPLGYAAGGIYEGFKAAGVKGALVGGITSFGVALAADVGVTTVLTAAGVTVAGLIAWPVVIGAGFIGTVIGKIILGKIFPMKVDKFKSKYQESILNILAEQKKNSQMEEELGKQIAEIFDGLKTNLHNETEQMLKTSEVTMDNIRQEKLKSEAEQKAEEARVAEIGARVNEIATRAVALNKRLGEMMGETEETA